MQPVANPTAPLPARDPQLWQLARQRARFQAHLLVYLAVNLSLWALWALLPEAHEAGELPWPVWTTLFWGIGLLNQGGCAYLGLGRGQRTQREYERLLSQGGWQAR